MRHQVGALVSGTRLTEARNVLLLGRPGTGKTHLATALGVAAPRAGHRVLFATATDWVTRLTDDHRAGRLAKELTKLRRYALIIVNEVGYLPFEQEAANLLLPNRVLPLRTRLADTDLEPAVQRLGHAFGDHRPRRVLDPLNPLTLRAPQSTSPGVPSTASFGWKMPHCPRLQA